MKRYDIIVITFILISLQSLNAQELKYNLNGNLREWVGAFVQTPVELGVVESRMKLELSSMTGEFSSVKVSSYYIYDGLKRNGIFELPEAYFNYYSDLVEVRFGRQIITWGKADELNPTDVLCPQNLTNILEDKGIRKIGQIFLNTDWTIEEFTITAIWKLEFDNIKIPALDSRWAFFSIPGITLLPDPIFPNSELKNTEWAFKLSRTIDRFDFSVSWFDGWDNIFTPVIKFNPSTQRPELDKLIFHRTKMLGADFATAFGPAGLWGEGAYFFTEDIDGVNPNIKNPYIQFVLGADYDFGDALKINFQFFQQVNTMIDNDEEEAIEEGNISKLGIGLPIQQAISCRIEKKFGIGEAHKVELLSLFDTKQSGLMLQPKFTYSIEDVFSVELGAAIYGGESESLFGRYEDNDIVYVKGTYSF